jgi:hypothetical protein
MRFLLGIASAVTFSAASFVSLSAQQGGAERSGPAQPPLWLPDDAYLRWPLPPGERAYAALDAHRIKSYINEITAISRKSRDDGNQYWGRITGTPYDKMTTDWIAAQFARVGLEQVRTQEFTKLPPQWFPTSWEVVASGPPLRQLATATIRLEPFGTRQEPHQTTFNARVGKKLTLSGRSLNVSFDVLNVTNSNAITAVTYVSGPSFGRVSDIVPPRTLRVAATFDF